jgi:hypothetical protein
MKAGKLALCVGANANAKTSDDLFNGFGNLGTPIDECVAEPETPTAPKNAVVVDDYWKPARRDNGTAKRS